MSLSRRHWLQFTAALAGTSSGWLPALADQTAAHPDRRRSCILLWMTGGPSQTDTFDLKPGHENGGPFRPIDTSVPGIQIGEHLPKLARQMHHAAVIRSMSTKEGDHTRATYQLRTGYLPQGPVNYPTMGSVLSKQLGSDEAELPNYVSIAPYRFLSPGAYGPGFLGPRYAPLVVGGTASPVVPSPSGQYANALQVKNLDLPAGVSREQADARLDLLGDFERDFLSRRGGVSAESHRMAYDKAVRMMRSDAAKAFQLDDEPDALRDAYGRNSFGDGCLLARRLVERGVPFVEVSLTQVPGTQAFGWDTHANNFEALKVLCGALDPAWATLLDDLDQRGLLDSTMVVWMGEFGRTPKINNNQGRDHYPAAWSTVLCGGGIRTGQVVGKTSEDGLAVEDRPVAVADLMATICKGLGVDPMEQNMSNVGRPIRLADPGGEVVEGVLL